MSNVKNIEFKVGSNTYKIETGELALQANGAVQISVGETIVLVAATASKKPREGIDFFPLMVDYEEKMYAIGKIPGSYQRRESRPPESAILTSRLIDRPIRPLFPDGYRNDVQVIATLVSSDQSTQADVIAINGASAALALSDIPFNHPVGAVRMGWLNNKWVIDPTYEETTASSLDLVIAGTEDGILMVEAGSNMLNEEMMLSAIEIGHKEIKKIVASIKKFVEMAGKPKQTEGQYTVFLPDQKLTDYVESRYYDRYNEAMHVADKAARKDALSAIKDELKAHLAELDNDNEIKSLYNSKPEYLLIVIDRLEEKIMKKMVLKEKVRIDGRGMEDVRFITTKTGFLPRAHGSGLFTRGQTQVMSVATLGSAGDMQNLDEVDPEVEKKYLHHYNFPAFSVGEVKPLRSPGRREVGHGNLARRALLPVLPEESDFPYTIRVVSEVLGSNGSSSMASTCGSTLALLDAGVPLKKMVGGVAMGLIMGDDGEYAILTDILGDEDHLGDMDFKVTGTLTGITALQMDIKIQGISVEIMRNALEQARKGRIHILHKMMETITEPKADLSQYAPRIITIKIPQEKIGELIGPGGKTIKKIVEETGVKIDIDDTGTVFIVSTEREASDKAKAWVERLTRVAKAGEIYDGRVTRITNFGAFVEIYPGTEGLIHISQLSEQRVRSVEDVVKVGQSLTVKISEVDNQGRVNLTRRGLEVAEVTE
ncbi:polyribonucleotide nucleotidyltransferase [bacterium]|nr:MAG: polyribonucleotide nucleotidyltransferase [bacterium]